MSKLLNLYPVKDTNNVMGLRKLYDICEVQIRSLESLKVTSGMYGHLLYPILIKLIPEELSLNFNRKRLEKESPDKFDVMELLNFLKKEIECRESVLFQNSKVEKRKNFNNYNSVSKPQHGFVNSGNSRESPRYYNSPKVNKTVEYLAPITENICIFCKSKHNSEQCLSVKIDDKKDILRKEGRCFLCLQKNHRIKDCNKQEFCDICHRKHNRALCYQLEKTGDKKETKIVTAASHCQENNKNDSVIKSPCGIYLQTCTATVKSSVNEENLPVRILLDNGSMRTFVLREVSEKLKLPVVRTETLSVYAFGVDEAQEKSYDVVKIHLENRNQPSLNIDIEALVTDKISATNLPTPETNIPKMYKQLKGLQLADSYKYRGNKIVILIGSDFYFDVVTGRIKRLDKKLVASETIFGWCIQGQGHFQNELLSMKIIVEEKSISDQLQKFWTLEGLGINEENEAINSENDDVLKKFESEIKYENSRYKVKWPWRSDLKYRLQDNRVVAEKRFSRLKLRFRNDPELFNSYKSVIEDYLDQNIIEPVQNTVDDENQVKFYLPHREVIRDDRTTSKLRIVFDASSHLPGELSLNDCLHVGPNLYPDLYELLLSFREYPIAFAADIQKAFLQIEIDEGDRDVTRFFWNDDPNQDQQSAKIYRFRRVLFGINSSPFLLSATIKHHLKKYSELYPHTSELLNRTCYVDDIITGDDDVEGAFKTSLECIDIFKGANMTLHKWQTNSKQLKDLWVGSDIHVLESPEAMGQPGSTSRVLGISWDTESDSFFFDTQNIRDFISGKTDTKRLLLQVAGRVFDPLGFLGPFIMQIKCLIQEVWCLGIDWDSELPPKLKVPWNNWCNELSWLDELLIPRYYFNGLKKDEIERIDLHCFCDASLKAYGTVIYARITSVDGTVRTSFITSKGRVAPLKTLSLPRLELMGALLSSRLCTRISKTLKCYTKCHLWTDSKIVYHWIRGNPIRFKPFVRNRLEEIHKVTNPEDWHHCPGKGNPADLISRGLSFTQLKNSDLWWHGPPWLRQSEESWPLAENFEVDNKELELRSKFENIAINKCVSEPREHILDLNKFSSLTKVLRITSWILRFVSNCRKPVKLEGTLTATELKRAEELWIKEIQNESYSTEISTLEREEKIKQNSGIFSLAPFLDSNKILRISGRLDEAELTLTEKHPVLLPKNSRFTELLVNREHNKVMHSGVSSTLTNIRRNYWIPKGRQLIKKIINKCLICKKYSAKPANQITGQLPKDRIAQSPPFVICGVDFAGPVFIKNASKNDKLEKSYIALFTCAVTRAVHLELVSTLSTECFLLAFRRFISRRGNCSVIYSDNAKTFKSANRELQNFSKILKSQEFQDYIATKEITWKFIVERAPWWGGFYERLVKSIKDPLRKVLGRALLTFEELSTILTEVETIVNLRPLTYTTSDFGEPEPLTPAQFLQLGRDNLDFPLHFAELEHKISTKESLLRRKRYQSKLLKQLWEKWKQQYLLNLKSAHHFKTPELHKNLKVGDVVLIDGTSKNKLLWDLGVIKEVLPGRDGNIRACMVKSAKRLGRMPVQLLYPLEVTDIPDNNS